MIGYGFLVPIAFVFLYWLVMLPEMGLDLLATLLRRKRMKLLPAILDLAGAFYKYSVIASWIVSIFLLFLGKKRQGST